MCSPSKRSAHSDRGINFGSPGRAEGLDLCTLAALPLGGRAFKGVLSATQSAKDCLGLIDFAATANPCSVNCDVHLAPKTAHDFVKQIPRANRRQLYLIAG